MNIRRVVRRQENISRLKQLKEDWLNQRKNWRIEIKRMLPLDTNRRYTIILFQRHQQQEIEGAQQEEFNKFNEYWDQKMSEFEEEANNINQQTVQRHQEELQQFMEELDNSIPKVPKDSGELLSLRKTEESLARQEQYMEAHQIQQRIMQIEQEEMEKWHFARQQKIKNLIQQMKQKQQNELAALQQRIFSGQEEQRKTRSMELEKILQKYQNVKKELQSQQNQQKSRLDKQWKMQSAMTGSRMMNSKQKTIEEEY